MNRHNPGIHRDADCAHRVNRADPVSRINHINRINSVIA